MFYELFVGNYTKECRNLKTLKSEIIRDIQNRYQIMRLRVDPHDGDYENDVELVIKDIKFKLEKKK